jgi:undecaprenyl-diphosphatase
VNPLIAALYGIVEGLTEYLPVSSTGHLILLARLLHREAGTFEIVIQFGAIFAVLVHYRGLLLERFRGLFSGDPRSRALLLALGVGFLPMAVVGYAIGKKVKEALFAPIPVAIALIAGGVLMIAIERLPPRGEPIDTVDGVTLKHALVVGLGQCLAIFPGASRSMCTIVAGRLVGLSRRTAAEFSFLLGLPTLGAATAYSALKERKELIHGIGLANVGIGMVVSFFVAWAVVAVFLRYLTKRGLEPFGVYRIVLGIVVLVALRDAV